MSTSHGSVWEYFQQVILPDAVKYQVREERKVTSLGDLLEEVVKRAPVEKVSAKIGL